MTPPTTPTTPTRSIDPAAAALKRRERRRVERQRAIRRRRAAAGLLALATLGLVIVASLWLGVSHPRRLPRAGALARSAPLARAPFALREQDLTFTDPTRWMALRDGTREPRRVATRVLYPVAGAGRRLRGPFPLVVFGHGFALEPGDYWPLLTAWARAGYVVAAPIFPLENAAAPGGPNEADLSNQPGDMSLVISRLLSSAARPASPLYGLINPSAIAVAGHSDGGDSALAVAEGSNRDHRVAAAVVLAGALLPGGSLDSGGPPLLAIQGTADTVNPPSATDSFLAALTAPKFLVSLPGAGHLPPYSRQQPQARVVASVTLAFFDRYLKDQASAAQRLAAAANVAGVAQLSSSS